MTEFDPRKPLSRPSTPVTTTWFEFLLDPSLLEKHLAEEKPDPSACDLIALFLYHADVAATTAREISDKEKETSATQQPITVEDQEVAALEIDTFQENKKIKALKLLALKVASHLKWNLNALSKNLPVAMVHMLLIELMKATGADPVIKNHANMVSYLDTIPQEVLFSMLLYHMWCIATTIQESFPSSSASTSNLAVPGRVDPTLRFAAQKEATVQIAAEGMHETSMTFLTGFLKTDLQVVLPALQCFGCMDDDSDAVLVSHDWTKALGITAQDMVSQASYILGCAKFFVRIPQEAKDYFTQTDDNLQQLEQKMDLLFCDVDKARLKGYMCACNGLLGVSPPPSSQPPSLVESIEMAKKNKCEDVVRLLKEDNWSQKLCLTYRESIQEEVMAMKRSDNLHLEVASCNTVRFALVSMTVPSEYIEQVKNNTVILDFLIHLCVDVAPKIPLSQKNNLKYFLRYMCYSLPSDENFIHNVLNSSLSSLFTPEEVTELNKLLDLQAEEAATPEITSMPFMSGGDVSEMEELKRKLLVEYDPATIKDLLYKLHSEFRVQKYPLMHLTDQWRVNRDLHLVLESLPVVKMQIYTHVLVCKAQICIQLKLYDRAWDLLHATDKSVKDISYRLSKLLGWELLRVEVLRYGEQSDNPMDEEAVKDLAKKCKSCIQQEHSTDTRPSLEVITLATSYLLNVKEWDFLSNLKNDSVGLIEFSRLASALCKELPLIKNARKPAREFWDAVVLIFTSSMQQKRTSTGNPSVVRRENMGIMYYAKLITFITKLKEPVIISALISCLTKLYNMLKDDVTGEISSDYFTLWPSALSNASGVNIAVVSEAVTTLMEHALKVNPNQPSWIRTQADICYALNQHSQSLRYYLDLGSVCTDYFNEPITKNIYDDNVYKKMIKCCSYLGCHTQVAVLCQFLDEVDYVTAFKAVQEKNSHDAMDSYYDCIWDVTILEYLINLHSKKGETDKKLLAMKTIGQPELNSSNPPDILREAENLRRAKFLRALAQLYT